MWKFHSWNLSYGSTYLQWERGNASLDTLAGKYLVKVG